MSFERSSGLGGDRRRVLEMLMRRAVVTAGEGCPLTRLALARRRVAAGDATVEESCLDLLLDERGRGAYALPHRPRDLCLRPDREVASDVGEESPVGA